MKLNLDTLLQKDRFIQVFAFIVAAIGWITVAMTISQQVNRTVQEVPVDMGSQLAGLSRLGLSAVGEQNAPVNVMVRGDRSIIGQLTPEDIYVTVTPNSNITEPGPYNLALQASINNPSIEILGLDPEFVRIRLERMATQSFPIQFTINGAVIPSGYIQNEAYTIPEIITVTGPQAELNRIESCRVEANVNAVIEKTVTLELPVQLFDKDGDLIDLEARYLTLDNDSVQLIIPIYMEKELPVTVRFNGVPPNFPLEELSYYVSNETIWVAGPISVINSRSELNLDYINLRELDPSRVYIFDVDLPDYFINLDNIQTVTVEFVPNDMSTTVFQSISPITVVNAPASYNIEVVTEQINNVTFIGDIDDLGVLSASDIVAEINISEREISPGQIKLPVTIYAPGKGLVWAVGDYSAVVQISEKTQ